MPNELCVKLCAKPRTPESHVNILHQRHKEVSNNPMNLFPSSRLAAELGWYVLFPGFFFYNFLVTAGAFPNLFGGLFGPATVALTVLFFPAIPNVIAKYRRVGEGVLVLFAALFFHWTVWFLIQHYTTASPHRDEAALQVVTLLFSTFALFMMGVTLPFEHPRFQKLILFSALAIGGVVVAFFDYQQLIFNPRAQYDVTEGVSTYQGYARSGLMVSLFLLGNCPTFLAKISVSFASLVILFLLGARSELFAFIGLVGTLLVLDARRSRKTLVAMACIIPIAFLLVLQNMDLLLMSRQMQVLDLDSATSWIARQHFLAVALRQITEHPFLGLYAGNFEAGHEGRYYAGTYAHNAISAWVTFGLVGFLLYVALTTYAALLSLVRYLKDDNQESIWRYSFYVNSVALLLVCVSKPVFWTIPSFGWGLVLNTLFRSRMQHQRKP